MRSSRVTPLSLCVSLLCVSLFLSLSVLPSVHGGGASAARLLCCTYAWLEIDHHRRSRFVMAGGTSRCHSIIVLSTYVRLGWVSLPIRILSNATACLSPPLYCPFLSPTYLPSFLFHLRIFCFLVSLCPLLGLLPSIPTYLRRPRFPSEGVSSAYPSTTTRSIDVCVLSNCNLNQYYIKQASLPIPICVRSPSSCS